MISNLNRKPRQLSASFSFNNSTSFIQCPDGSVKRRRHKSSYKDLYLEKLNFVPTQMPAVKGVDYGYSSMYQNNSVNISSRDFKFNSLEESAMGFKAHKRVNSGSKIKEVKYKVELGNNKGNKDDKGKKRKKEMILDGLGIDRSFENKYKCEEVVSSKRNEDDINFVITDRQGKNELKGTLVDHNENGDYEDMNEIKNQLDNAITHSVNNKKEMVMEINVNNTDTNNNEQVNEDYIVSLSTEEKHIVNNDKEITESVKEDLLNCYNNTNNNKRSYEYNETDKDDNGDNDNVMSSNIIVNENENEKVLITTSQNDVNVNNNKNNMCNVLFKSDSLNYSNDNEIETNNNNNNDNNNDNEYNILQIKSKELNNNTETDNNNNNNNNNDQEVVFNLSEDETDKCQTNQYNINSNSTLFQSLPPQNQQQQHNAIGVLSTLNIPLKTSNPVYNPMLSEEMDISPRDDIVTISNNTNTNVNYNSNCNSNNNITTSIPINFQSTASLDIKKSTPLTAGSKQSNEMGYSIEENDDMKKSEQRYSNQHQQIYLDSNEEFNDAIQKEGQDNWEDDDNDNENDEEKVKAVKGKGYFIHSQEIKEEEDENDESMGGSILKSARRKKDSNYNDDNHNINNINKIGNNDMNDNNVLNKFKGKNGLLDNISPYKPNEITGHINSNSNTKGNADSFMELANRYKRVGNYSSNNSNANNYMSLLDKIAYSNNKENNNIITNDNNNSNNNNLEEVNNPFTNDIQSQKKSLLDIIRNKSNTNNNHTINSSNDNERLQEIKTFLRKNSNPQNQPSSPNNNNNSITNNNTINNTPHTQLNNTNNHHSFNSNTIEISHQTESFTTASKPNPNKTPLIISNMALTIEDTSPINPQHKPTQTISHSHHMSFIKEQSFNVLPSKNTHTSNTNYQIYSPNNVGNSPNIRTINTDIKHNSPSQFEPNELHSEIDDFINNLKQRNKSKESHLASLKLQKTKELLQLKEKQEYLAKQKIEASLRRTIINTSNLNGNSYIINNILNDNNNNNNENDNNTISIFLSPSSEQPSFIIQTNHHHHRKHSYTNIYTNILDNESHTGNNSKRENNNLDFIDKERYNTLRNNIKRRNSKSKISEMFKNEIEKEYNPYLNKVKEDVRDIENKRKIKGELNGIHNLLSFTNNNNNNNQKNKYEGNCVMPANSIDDIIESPDFCFFSNYNNNSNINTFGKTNVNNNNNNNPQISGINMFNKYTFKK